MKTPVLQPPTDGFTSDEKLFIREVFVKIYETLQDPVSQFILIAHFECGYTQDEISAMMGISQPTIAIRIQKARIKLKRMKMAGKI